MGGFGELLRLPYVFSVSEQERMIPNVLLPFTERRKYHPIIPGDNSVGYGFSFVNGPFA